MFGAKPLGNTSSFNLGPTSGFSLNKPFGASTGIGTGFGTGIKDKTFLTIKIFWLLPNAIFLIFPLPYCNKF